ncbi:hypothetical protein Ancab_033875 [Ancistrocladus abbreviatus]
MGTGPHSQRISVNLWSSKLHLDNQHKSQQGHNEEQNESILEGKGRQSNKTCATQQPPITQPGTPVNSIPSSANKQNTGSNPAQFSSRWSSHEDREEPILEICDRHNSPSPSRYDGKKARAEERGKWDADDSALIVRQQSGDGDLFEGKRLTDE